MGKKDTVGQRGRVSCLIITAFSNRDILFSYFEASGLEKCGESTLPPFLLALFPLRISGLQSLEDEDFELEGPQHSI